MKNVSLYNASCCSLKKKNIFGMLLQQEDSWAAVGRATGRKTTCVTRRLTLAPFSSQGITRSSILTLLQHLSLCNPLSLASLCPELVESSWSCRCFWREAALTLGELPPSTCGAGSALTPLPLLLLLLLLPVAPAGAGGGRSPGSESTPGFALQCTHSSTSTCTPPRHHHHPTLLLFCNFQKIL